MPSPKTKQIRKKHPLAIRWFHWVNFPILFLMIWSGLGILGFGLWKWLYNSSIEKATVTKGARGALYVLSSRQNTGSRILKGSEASDSATIILIHRS